MLRRIGAADLMAIGEIGPDQRDGVNLAKGWPNGFSRLGVNPGEAYALLMIGRPKGKIRIDFTVTIARHRGHFDAMFAKVAVELFDIVEGNLKRMIVSAF